MIFGSWAVICHLHGNYRWHDSWKCHVTYSFVLVHSPKDDILLIHIYI